MTGFIEPLVGIGHNQPDPMEMEKKNQKWERWAKKRTLRARARGHLQPSLQDAGR